MPAPRRPMVIAHHVVWTAYGTWLPNDPRGSGSRWVAAEVLAGLGPLHYGRKQLQPHPRVVREYYNRAEPRLKLDSPVITRMFTMPAAGTDAYVLDPSGNTSHFIWRDPKHVLAWTQPAASKPGFYLFTDKTKQAEQIGRDVMTENGHCTFLPGNRWILNDTYPDRETKQHP